MIQDYTNYLHPPQYMCCKCATIHTYIHVCSCTVRTNFGHMRNAALCPRFSTKPSFRGEDGVIVLGIIGDG